MRVAIYGRVSTTDKGQDPENQLHQLREWSQRSGHEIVGEYVDHETGRKGADRRKRFAALFDDAGRRKFDLVVFWALDRFSREGMVPTVMHLQRLSSHGIAFHSYTEQHLSTDNELVRNVLLAVMSSLAKIEAQKIGERTKAGMARARAAGKRIGRPGLSRGVQAKIAKHAAQGVSAYRISQVLGIDHKTVVKYVRLLPDLR
jgi:DNA invertase Pin-like site-specific DNA recombinase